MADRDVDNVEQEPRDDDARDLRDDTPETAAAEDETSSPAAQRPAELHDQANDQPDELTETDEPVEPEQPATLALAPPDEEPEPTAEPEPQAEVEIDESAPTVQATDADEENEDEDGESDEDDLDEQEQSDEQDASALTDETDQSDDSDESDETEDPEDSEQTAEHDPSDETDGPDEAGQPGPAARHQDDADADTDTLEAPEGIGEPEVTTERVIEAVLFASDAPLPLSKIVSVLGVGSARDVRNHIKALNEKYAQTGASFRIEQIASGYQMLTLPVYNNWIRRLKQSKQDSRLSQAAMETLAVVAYKQPVIRADIEAIRGVSAGEMLNRLREVGLIKIVGRAEDVGRPMLYGTTKRFLEVFGLSGLEDLPPVEELQPGQQ